MYIFNWNKEVFVTNMEMLSKKVNLNSLKLTSTRALYGMFFNNSNSAIILRNSVISCNVFQQKRISWLFGQFRGGISAVHRKIVLWKHRVCLLHMTNAHFPLFLIKRQTGGCALCGMNVRTRNVFSNCPQKWRMFWLSTES